MIAPGLLALANVVLPSLKRVQPLNLLWPFLLSDAGHWKAGFHYWHHYRQGKQREALLARNSVAPQWELPDQCYSSVMRTCGAAQTQHNIKILQRITQKCSGWLQRWLTETSVALTLLQASTVLLLKPEVHGTYTHNCVILLLRWKG